MEESFCRLGIFIRPRLQFLVWFCLLYGHLSSWIHFFYFSICQSYNQFTISHHDLFGIWNNNYDFYCKTYLQNFTWFWCLYVSVWWTAQKAVWCCLESNFSVTFSSTSFPVSLLLIGINGSSVNVTKCVFQLTKYAPISDVEGCSWFAFFPLWHELPGAGFTEETWTLFSVWLWV